MCLVGCLKEEVFFDYLQCEVKLFLVRSCFAADRETVIVLNIVPNME